MLLRPIEAVLGVLTGLTGPTEMVQAAAGLGRGSAGVRVTAWEQTRLIGPPSQQLGE